ncbi:hypothetical protein HMPREF1212_01255 [Parabacteroides sp. HGS0025]|uniref:DUF3945 domain-containing protein n=1 Tax=Parabacteroides sp. HGS0025 TaxID=1078087 RepID=UPI000617377E|nr:DUF3945 domain-containing protein [Parabacteroides sp. HGS0025]KKB53092.1 hypothetical protein HMPREF1212_01255 [Parabacteroides sp. HGS0025]
MAEENIRGDTQQKTPPIENEQLSDIILILDKMELLIQAVSKLGKDGKHETVPADEKHKNSFLKVDKFSSIVENFLKNFWSQIKDPTHFGILTMKMNEMDKPENKQAIKDLAEGKKTDAVAEFLKKYEIKPKDVANEQSNNKKNDETMAKKTAQQEQTQVPATQNDQPKYRYNEAMINWDQLKNFGLSKEFLQEKGLLDQMLKGYKTNQTVPITMNFGSAVLRTDARLSFQQSVAGPVVLGIHGIRQQPELDKPYFGHIFSEEDKKNLKETGNMGRVVELKTRTGEYAPSFVSLDKMTNEIVAMKVENAYIPNEIKEVKLTEQEKNDLKEGKSIYLEGMKAASGNEFNAHVQFNADRRGIEFQFETDKIFNRQTLGGVELSPKQTEDLNNGKAIFVEDMVRKDGEKFSAFVKLDEASGRPSYTRYNPDSPEGAREIYIPKEMNGVVLTPQDREELGQGKAVFLENMVNRKGEDFSSFVKLDLETGRPSYSRTPDGFTERQEFKIPPEVWGVTLTATQRGQLQDGKAVLVEGMKGYDGKQFSQYVKVNQNQGRLDYYNENPDRKRDASQRNVVAQGQNQQQDNKKARGKSLG